MTKEEIFKLMKEVILALKDEEDKLMNDSLFQQEWSKKHKAVDSAIKQLNSCDASWLTDEYAKWFKAEIEPNIPEGFPKP